MCCSGAPLRSGSVEAVAAASFRDNLSELMAPTLMLPGLTGKLRAANTCAQKGKPTPMPASGLGIVQHVYCTGETVCCVLEQYFVLPTRVPAHRTKLVVLDLWLRRRAPGFVAQMASL